MDDVMQDRNLQEFMGDAVGASNMALSIRMAAIFWVIWTERNNRIWRDKSTSNEILHRQVECLRASWKETFKPATLRGQATGSPVIWEPPAQGWLKCNVDAAVLADGVGFGAVVRNHEGRFVAAMNGRLSCDREPFMAEATAVKESLTWLHNFGRGFMVIETNCLNFCKAFNSSSLNFSYVNLIVKQCVLIANGIGNVSVHYV
ncbi:PREDICTED: uncharacterized protein LOC109179342 [Ipomoea nil]|uniref:uncharacterized protein LOC109179342 n=1 Tax=Ipomoea nil TaxID=35883 RepID=UPI000900EDCC|nr:PREDICTED: uncharacterized protein LOC109179342 [Ipomoea nil]